jgi:hypothetical protein
MKTLVIYVFHVLNKNVLYFLQNALFEDENVTFLVVCNSHIKISLPSYVKVLNRENIGYDYGGWSYGLLTDNLYTTYDNFIFVNSSALGPFIPSYYKNKWTDIYINGLTDNVKLFGSSINCSESVYGLTKIEPIKNSHIQSYIFSMNKETLLYLIECGIFSITEYVTDFIKLVFEKEIKMSRLIIEKGWNIGCLMDIYKDVDFTFKQNQNSIHKNINYLGDVMNNAHYNKTWTLKEIVFIKGNRIFL